MLQGAFAPPYWPAFPAHKLGSISLCGGERSNCAHPQNMSLGKNIRSPGSAACQLLCELGSCEGLCRLREGEIWAPASEINTGTASIHANTFISPPKFLHAASQVLSLIFSQSALACHSEPEAARNQPFARGCCRNEQISPINRNE